MKNTGQERATRQQILNKTRYKACNSMDDETPKTFKEYQESKCPKCGKAISRPIVNWHKKGGDCSKLEIQGTNQVTEQPGVLVDNLRVNYRLSRTPEHMHHICPHCYGEWCTFPCDAENDSVRSANAPSVGVQVFEVVVCVALVAAGFIAGLKCPWFN